MNKKGFTLAEVLITLSIIAVISILTIPSIVKNYRYKTYAASAQKIYSQLEDAISSIMTDEMAELFNQTTAGVSYKCTTAKETGACYFLRHYFKVANDCPGRATYGSKCLAKSYTTITGAAVPAFYGDHCIQTTNGATICMEYTVASGIPHFVFDVNGPAQPNIVGLDVYTGRINAETGEIEAWGTDETTCGVKVTDNGHVGDYAQGCLYKLIKNGWVVKE